MYIDWGNKIIQVLKADMTQIQSSPTSIYEMDIDEFRATLNDLSDDAEGIHYATTHQHVAPVSVGGVTLARVVELINDYTVTFENGQYAVNLIGANSNVGDKVNVNQVSIRSANSAGLVDTGASLTTNGIAAAVWDSDLSEFQDAGSTGEALDSSGGGTTPSAIADAVWDETLSGHSASGSAGESLNSSGEGGTPGDIADAVWDRNVTSNATAGTFGEKIGKKLLTLAQWVGLR